jgi:hypothetical protein
VSRTTLQIDDDVLAAARTLARDSGESVGHVISELARRGLRPEMSYGEDQGFPVFEVREGTPLINPDDVRRALDDLD